MRPPATGGAGTLPLPPPIPAAHRYNATTPVTPARFPLRMTSRAPMEEENIADFNRITAATITVPEILAEKPSLTINGYVPTTFRSLESIQYILEHPEVVKVFYIATHGQALNEFYTCPANTLLLQPGAGELCHGAIYTMYEPVLLQGTNLTQTLYEMLGLCKKPSLPYLSTLYYRAAFEPTPNKGIWLEKEDDPEQFGVYYVDQVTGYIARVTDESITKPLALDMPKYGGIKTDEYIAHLNSIFTGSINLYYFSSCSSLPKSMKFAGIADLWANPTHYSEKDELYRTMDCGIADPETARYFMGGTYVPSDKVRAGPSPAGVYAGLGLLSGGIHGPVLKRGGGRSRRNRRHRKRTQRRRC